MKRIICIFACALPMSIASIFAQNPAVTAPATPTQEQPAKPVNMDDVSYSIGVDIGRNFKRNMVDPNMDEFITGLKAGMSESEIRMTDAEMQELMMAFQKKMREDMMKADQEMAATNLKAAEEFLAENAKKDGVKVTDSGLQYEVLEEGTGPQPKPTDKVKAVYKGTLIDGTVFDDSRGQPREFSVTGVVKGWQEALPMMKTGGKWKLFVPPSLAYGERRPSQLIAPNSLLVFEIELVEISKPVSAVTPAVRAPIPTQDGTPRKRITAVTPPVSVPMPPKKEGEEAPKPAVPVEEKKTGE